MKIFAKLAILSILLSPLSVWAALITYNFTGVQGTSVPSLTYTESDVTVSITALKDFGGANTAANVHINANNGLGVTGSPDGNRIGTNEALIFDWNPFSGALLSGLVFEHAGGVEIFDIYVDGVLSLNDIAIGAPGGGNIIDLDFSSSSLQGSSFAFVGQSGSGIRIKGLTIDVEVPSPSTIAMFGVALAGVFLARRRRS